MSEYRPRSSRDRILKLSEEYRARGVFDLKANATVRLDGAKGHGPKGAIPRRLRLLFWCIHALGRLQARLSRMTDQQLYCSSDGRTMLVSAMDDKHLHNALKKMEREGRSGWMYDCLMKERSRRTPLPRNVLQEATDAVAERDKPLWKKILKVPA